MIRIFRDRGWIVGGVLVLGCLVVGLVAAEVGGVVEHQYYLPAVPYTYGGLEWTEIGVPDVIEETFEIDQNEPETLYLGTYGPSWRSQDSGQSWELMSNGLPITRSVRHFAAAPLSPTLLYAEVTGGWPQQIYRSMDGGESWKALSWIHHYRLLSLAVNPITPTIIYAGAGIFDSTTYGGEVYRSTDGGYGWTRILPSFTMAMDIVVNPQNANVVYLGSSYNGLLKSEDGGDSWQAMNNGLPSDDVSVRKIIVHPDDSQIVYITADGKLYRSSDGGSHWVGIGSGLPVSWLSTLAMNPENPEMMFATPVEGDEYYGIYQSLDGGYSWERLAPSPVNHYARQLEVQGGTETSLIVLYNGYVNDDGRLWKLDFVP